MENNDLKGFTYLILDTNWWMYLATGEYTSVLDELKLKIDDGSIILLVPTIVLKEWKNHKKDVIKGIEDVIRQEINKLSKELQLSESNNSSSKKSKTKHYSGNKINKEAELRYKEVSNLIENQSRKIKVSSKVNHKAVKFALKKKAPFHRNKNSMADALIVFSTIEYLKNEENLGKDNAIFVSYNHKDFSQTTDRAEDTERYKEILHIDLKEEFKSIGLIYKRTFYDVIELSNELKAKLEARLEEEYWDYHIWGELDWLADVARGR